MGMYRIQPNGHAFKFVFQNPDQTQSGIGDGVPARSSQAGYRGGLQSLGIAIDGEGNLFFADSGNRRIRAIRYGAVMAEPGSTVAVSSGNSQTTPIGTAFPIVVQVTLKSPEGTLENGIRVDFAAPVSGASCTFPGGSSTYSTLTNIAGQASVTCTANAQIGAYSVTATPLALNPSVSLLLTNGARLLGDIDGNERVDLSDAILALQILSGVSPAGMVYKEADINGDGKIGIEEVIYILQKEAGIR